MCIDFVHFCQVVLFFHRLDRFFFLFIFCFGSYCIVGRFFQVCIFNSLMSLFWAMTLLVTVTYVFAILCTQGTATSLDQKKRTLERKNAKNHWNWAGGFVDFF